MSGLDRDAVLSAMTGKLADFYGQFALLKPSGGELRGPCPVHGGFSPSFAVNLATGAWYCHSGCQCGGDIFEFLMRVEGLTFPEALARVAAFAGVSDPASLPSVKPRPTAFPPSLLRSPSAATPARSAVLNPCLAEELHERLMNCDSMCRWLLAERGLTAETLERFRLGLQKDPRDGGFFRVCFPVYDRLGRLVNVRRHLFAYRPELTPEKRRALGKTKPWGAGLPALLFPLAALGGAGTWHEAWTQDLSGLTRVIVLYDADQPGEKGLHKAAASLARVVPDVRIARYDALLPDRER